MAWTLTDLERLERAIRTGARKVKYEDKEVEYRSQADMQRLRREMQEELGITSGEAGSRRRYGKFSKGLE